MIPSNFTIKILAIRALFYALGSKGLIFINLPLKHYCQEIDYSKSRVQAVLIGTLISKLQVPHPEEFNHLNSII